MNRYGKFTALAEQILLNSNGLTVLIGSAVDGIYPFSRHITVDT